MTLMSSLRDVATVRVALPPVPIARIALTSTDGPDATLELGIVTSLPVRESVARTVAPAEQAFELAISGSAMAELANWAIATGHAPARFDRSLEPDLDGDYVPHFDWRTDHPRPLIVHVDRVHGGCEWFTVGVTPTLAIEGEQLVAGASARDFEQVLGPAYLHVAVWLKELLQRAVSRRVAAAATLTVAGRRVEAHLVGATLDDRGLRAAATLRIAPPGS